MGALSMNILRAKSRKQNITQVRSINLSNLELSDLTMLNQIPYIEAITLNSNQISTLKYFSNCVYLREIHISHNLVTDFDELKHLKCLEDLISISLEGNPVAESSGDDYRNTLIRLLPRLTKIDNILISEEERDKALGREPAKKVEESEVEEQKGEKEKQDKVPEKQSSSEKAKDPVKEKDNEKEKVAKEESDAEKGKASEKDKIAEEDNASEKDKASEKEKGSEKENSSENDSASENDNASEKDKDDKDYKKERSTKEQETDKEKEKEKESEKGTDQEKDFENERPRGKERFRYQSYHCHNRDKYKDLYSPLKKEKFSLKCLSCSSLMRAPLINPEAPLINPEAHLDNLYRAAKQPRVPTEWNRCSCNAEITHTENKMLLSIARCIVGKLDYNSLITLERTIRQQVQEHFLANRDSP